MLGFVPTLQSHNIIPGKFLVITQQACIFGLIRGDNITLVTNYD